MIQPDYARAIAAMGTALGPDTLARCRALFGPEQQALVARVPALEADCAYGPHVRHRLDLYCGALAAGSRPILLFVHGGGFVQGDKCADGWANAAVGRMAAQQGWLGAVMNYRLAPDHGWPAGGEDVLAALDWLTIEAPRFGGDPRRIVLMGTSAGAVHVATAMQLRPDLAVRGAVLLSGLYGFTPLDARDERYYGDAARYSDRMPREAILQTKLPLLVATAEHDPARFQAEFLGLLTGRLERHGAMPRSYVASGHNHYSLAMHLGTPDRRLADEIAAFVSQICA